MTKLEIEKLLDDVVYAFGDAIHVNNPSRAEYLDLVTDRECKGRYVTPCKAVRIWDLVNEILLILDDETLHVSRYLYQDSSRSEKFCIFESQIEITNPKFCIQRLGDTLIISIQDGWKLCFRPEERFNVSKMIIKKKSMFER